LIIAPSFPHAKYLELPMSQLALACDNSTTGPTPPTCALLPEIKYRTYARLDQTDLLHQVTLEHEVHCSVSLARHLCIVPESMTRPNELNRRAAMQ
jgi:hypothetical protein